MFKKRFKDTKWVIKKPLKKEIQHNGQRKKNNRTNSKLIYKKLKIENEPH